MQYPESIMELIGSYVKFPGTGQKATTRPAFYTIGMKDEVVNEFAKSLLSVKRGLHFCSICGNAIEEDPYGICRNLSRDRSVIPAVEKPKDVTVMERIRECHGLYHIPHGVLSPMEGTGPEDINIPPPLQQLHDADVKEVIIATNATIEGEVTAMYLSCLIKPAGIRVTRLAYGPSVGSNIKCMDGVTLLKAAEERRELQIPN